MALSIYHATVPNQADTMTMEWVDNDGNTLTGVSNIRMEATRARDGYSRQISTSASESDGLITIAYDPGLIVDTEEDKEYSFKDPEFKYTYAIKVTRGGSAYVLMAGDLAVIEAGS
jgi:hypothetical protein